MSNPRQPAREPYYGPMYARSFVDRNLALLGQVNPIVKERFRMEHGRYLSGFGSASPSGATGYDPAYQDQHVYELEGQDDVYGSGIFDPKGRAGTANPTMGVFASHDSLPGYIAREVPFTVSRDVTDITDGAGVVIVPGGGMSYIESRGKLEGPAVLGPTWRPPQIQPAGYTSFDQVYAFMNKPGQEGTVLNPNAPVRPPPLYRPARTSPDEVLGVPMSPRGDVLVPFRRNATRIPYQSQVQPFVTTAPANPVTGPTVSGASPDLPSLTHVPMQSIVNEDVQFAPAHPVPPPHVAASAPDLPQRQVVPYVSTANTAVQNAPAHPVPPPHVAASAPDLAQRRVPPRTTVTSPMSGMGQDGGGMWPSRFHFPTSDPILPAQYPTHGGVFGAEEKESASPAQVAVAGFLAGGAVGLVYCLMKGNK